MSADGTTLAIGAINNGGGGSNAGHVRVYKYKAAPVPVPVPGPVTSLTKAPTKMPIKNLTKMPTMSPTKSPIATKTPTKAPVSPPTTKSPTKAPISPQKVPTKDPVLPPITPTVTITLAPQVPLPKTKPPVLGPITPGNIIDIYPGDDFIGAVNNAEIGDTIVFHQGNYISSNRISISVGGTLSSPVIIRNAVGESRPKILNTINIEGSSYLTIQGVEIVSTEGDGVKIATGVRDNYDITLEDLVIHNVSVGVNAKTNVNVLHVNRTHIFDISNSGEGISLGCDDGSCIISNSIIEYNWIHNTTSLTQGIGIEINKNSYGNIVRHNVVYQIKTHGILVYGSGNEAVNIIEGNVLWNCDQAGIKVAADAIVRNNLVFSSGRGLESDLHNGVSPKNLLIVHNTFISNDVCLFIRSWNGKSDIIFANNAAYCDADTFKLEGGYSNVQLSGNVFHPSTVSFPPTSFSLGREPSQDFASFTLLNAYPIYVSPLRDKADPKYAVSVDFDGTSRVNQLPNDVGAYEWTPSNTRKWAVIEGFKPFQVIDNGSTGPIPAPIQMPLPTVIPSPAPCKLGNFCIFGRKICFSSHNTVQILKRNMTSFSKVMSYSNRYESDTIMMSELKVGDYVGSSNGQYTRVISFSHKDAYAVASFIQIHSLLLPNNNFCMKHSNSMNKIGRWNINNHSNSLDRKDLIVRQSDVYDNDDVHVDSVHDVCYGIEPLPILELSHDHMVYVIHSDIKNRQQQHHFLHHPTKLARSSEKGWVRAVDLKIGDILVHQLTDHNDIYYGVVTDISTILRNDGVYAPITTTGSLYVSNTLVSSYVAVLQTNDLTSVIRHENHTDDISRNTIGTTNTITSSTTTLMLLFPPNVQHMIAHITLTPIRLLCQYDFEKYCLYEVYDDNQDNGYAWYSLYILNYVEWLESISTIQSPYMFPQFIFDSSLVRMIQWTTTIVIMVPFLLLYFVEGSLSLIMNGNEAYRYDNNNLFDIDSFSPANMFIPLNSETTMTIIFITTIMVLVVCHKYYGSRHYTKRLNL